MLRLLLLLLLALPLSARAATISSTTCPGTGCVTTYLGNLTATAVSVQVSGTWVGTLAFEGSNDNATYTALRAYPVDGNGSYTSSTTANGAWMVPASGLLYVRVRASAWTSGSATVLPQPTSSGVVVDIVRAVGSTFGEVAVSGTVGLSSATVTALGPQACVNGRAHRIGIDATAEPVPADLPDGGNGALTGRTMLLLQNPDATHSVSCSLDPGDGGVPDCATPGFGFTLIPRAPHVALPLSDAERLLCVACTGSSVPLEYLERSCSR